jgi:cytidylate kinase
MIVALDGPAGCGKSTIAKMLSERTGFIYLNSGSLYRAISYAAIGRSLGLDDRRALIGCARSISLSYDSDGAILLDGLRLVEELRSAAVDAIVAQVSAVPEIRSVVDAVVRAAARSKDVVVEGRDMTTVVFPDAEVKFYIDASVEERAKRRFKQKSSDLGFQEILDNIRMRDEIDRNKAVGALKIADDALYLDTSGLTIDQVYETVYSKILHVREGHGQ